MQRERERERETINSALFNHKINQCSLKNNENQYFMDSSSFEMRGHLSK